MKIYNNRFMVWVFFLAFTLTACSQHNHPQDQGEDKTPQKPSDQETITEIETVKSAKVQSAKAQLTWTELPSGLWQSNQGDFGLQVAVLNIDTLDFTTDYLTHTFIDGEHKYIKEVIDIDSFRQLSDSNFYKDTNHIYRFIAMAGGGTFSVLDEADYESFVVLNDCFAKDKHKIFHWRGIDEDYDYDSFQLCSDSRCIAKDKNNVYTLC